MARSIWVIAEVADGKLSRITTEVATAARGIAEQAGRDVVGVVVGADPGKPAEELARFVPRVLSVADPVTDGHASATLLAERVAALAADEPPDYLLLGASPEGRDAAGVLSVLLGWPVLANATGLGWADDGPTVEMSVFGGRLTTRNAFVGEHGIITIRPIAVTVPPRTSKRTTVMSPLRTPSPPAFRSITLTRPTKWTPLWSKLCHPEPRVPLP